MQLFHLTASHVALLIFTFSSPLHALRKRSSKVNETENIFDKRCYRCFGVIVPALSCPAAEQCEDYCSLLKSEPCPGRKSYCGHREGGCTMNCWNSPENGKCDCSRCPGKTLSKKELWQKVCDGACGSNVYCYFNGMSFVGDQMLEEVVGDWYWSSFRKRRGRYEPRCSSCILTTAKDKYGNNCAACEGQSSCKSIHEDLFSSSSE